MITYKEETAPSTPPTGYVRMYAKTDGKVYMKDDAGVETELAGTAAILKTLADAKGDIFVATADNTVDRLAVGADGTVLTADSTQTSGVKWGTSAAGKNAIINGALDIWQRSTSFGSVPASTYMADRWVYGKTSSVVHDVLRSTDVPTVAQANRLYNYSMHFDCTTADASIAAGDYCLFQQSIEGYNFAPLAQRAMVLSFWVKATKTGIYCVSFLNSGSDRSYVAEFTVNVTNTWEKKTIAVAASPSAGTWDYTNGLGLTVRFALAVGSTFQTSAGSWQTGNFVGTANQVNGVDSATNDFRITGVQLESGSTATDFEQRSFQQELILCQRYYCKSFPQATTVPPNFVTSVGPGFSAYDASTAVGYVPFPVEMRTTPTMTLYGDNSTTPGQVAFVGTGNVAISGTNADSRGMGRVSSAAQFGSANGRIQFHFVASAEL